MLIPLQEGYSQELLTGANTTNHYDRKGAHPALRVRNTLQVRIMTRRNGLRIVGDTQGSPLNGHGLIATEHLLVRHIFLLPAIVIIINYNHPTGNSAFRKPHRTDDPFSNPHVQRATGKVRTGDSASSWYSDSGSHYEPSGWGKRKSTASARAEEQHAREAEANRQTGLWNTLPTIGVTLLFLLLAHGRDAKA